MNFLFKLLTSYSYLHFFFLYRLFRTETTITPFNQDVSDDDSDLKARGIKYSLKGMKEHEICH